MNRSSKNVDQVSPREIALCRAILLYTLLTGQVLYLDTPKSQDEEGRGRAGVKHMHLSHNSPCFQCNIAITNFLVSNTCEIRFHDVIGQSTVPMYSYAKIPKHG